MGHDVNILGKHRLNTESVEALANDLSIKLRANIVYGYFDEFQWEIYDNSKELRITTGSYDWIVLGSAVSHPGEINIKLCDRYYQQRQIIQEASYENLNIISDDSSLKDMENSDSWFEIECLEEDGNLVQLDYVFKDFFCMYGDPGGRWAGFVHRLGFGTPWPGPQSINSFRRQVKSIANKLGCGAVYYVDDQGPAMDVELNGRWNDVVSELDSISKEKAGMEILSIQEIVSDTDYDGPHNYSDTYYDDFSDLE